MSYSVDLAFPFKGTDCVKLQSKKYYAVIAVWQGCSVLRFYDNDNKVDIFKYKDDCTINTIKSEPVIWGLPTLFFQNRLDKGILKTSDGFYKFPINEPMFNNFIHGWVHKRKHTIEKYYTTSNSAVLETSYTYDCTDEMYQYFPVDFKISYKFSLSENGLFQEIRVVNLSSKALPISLCTHANYNAPMTASGKEEDLRLMLPICEKCELDERFLPTQKITPLDDWDKEYKNGSKLPTTHVIENDLYKVIPHTLGNDYFSGMIITDVSTNLKICNEVSDEFKFWIVWNHDGKKGYFCCEPMTALVNAPNLSLPHQISGYTELAKNEEYYCWQRFFTKNC